MKNGVRLVGHGHGVVEGSQVPPAVPEGRGPYRGPVVSKHDVMTRLPLAFGVSLAVHAGLVVLLVSTAARLGANEGGVPEGPRTIQLNGRPQERQAGRDMLSEVLRGDGVPVRLTSPTGGAAVGLAWWSPHVGLWLAADRLPASLSGRSLHVTLQIDDATAIAIGDMHIDEEGSGRIVTAWAHTRPSRGTPVSLIVSDPGSVPGGRSPSMTLRGSAQMR